MKKILVVGFLFWMGNLGAARAPTAITKVEGRLAELLTPGASGGGIGLSSQPLPRSTLRLLEKPELPLGQANVLPPAPPAPAARPVQPRATQEETPLARFFGQPEPPQVVTMPTGPLVRLWSGDSNEPLPVAILSEVTRDRASLADPSLDASVAVAQSKLEPARAQPVPFQAANLPDPFEHSHAIRLRNPPEEEPAPLSLTVPGRR